LENAAAPQRRDDQMMDAVRQVTRPTIYQTPVGFKYIGRLSARTNRVRWRRKRRANIAVHPGEDGILACLLVAENDRRDAAASIGEQVRAMYKKLGREFCPSAKISSLRRTKGNAVKRVAVDASTLAGRKVVSIDRTDGANLSWKMVRGCAALFRQEPCSACTSKRKRLCIPQVDAGKAITMGYSES